jgi:hypothetical protein
VLRTCRLRHYLAGRGEARPGDDLPGWQAAKWRGRLRGDLIVVSEVRAVALPASRRVDLACCCPWGCPLLTADLGWSAGPSAARVATGWGRSGRAGLIERSRFLAGQGSHLARPSEAGSGEEGDMTCG